MGGIRATQDNAVAISSVYEQEEVDGDWVDNTPSIDYKLPEIVIGADSTSTALQTFTAVAGNDPVRSHNGTDGLVEGSLGTTTAAGTTDTHDIFGDGSAVATYMLDGNANDLGGNYNPVSDNTQTIFTDSLKFGNCATVYTNSNGQKIEVPSLTYKSFSFWVNLNAHDDDDNAVLNYNFKRQSNSDTRIGTNNGWISLGVLHPEQTLVHVVCTISGTTLSVYHNNSLWVSKTVSADTLFTSASFLYASDSASFNGTKIDQVRIFNRSLSSAEVNTLYNEEVTKYTADISSLRLTQAPTKAFFNKPVEVGTVTESIANRCIAQDETLDFVSSTTSEYVGTNAISGLLQDGDSINTDLGDIVCSSVVETDLGGGSYQYTCTIPPQASAPTRAKVLDRSITTTEASDVYDDVNDKFVKTYDTIVRQGRAFKYKIEADEGVEVTKVAIPMSRER